MSSPTKFEKPTNELILEIMKTYDQPMTAPEILCLMPEGTNAKTVGAQLSIMNSDGIISRVKKGQYIAKPHKVIPNPPFKDPNEIKEIIDRTKHKPKRAPLLRGLIEVLAETELELQHIVSDMKDYLGDERDCRLVNVQPANPAVYEEKTIVRFKKEGSAL